MPKIPGFAERKLLQRFMTHCDQMFTEHMRHLNSDYQFPLSDEDSAGLCRFLLKQQDDPSSRTLIAQILVGASRHVAAQTIAPPQDTSS
jgi:hypothetical protein